MSKHSPLGQDHNIVTALGLHQRSLRRCWKTSSNIGNNKSFVYDLNKERGIVRTRVAFVPRSAEIKPLFWRFVFRNSSSSPHTTRVGHRAGAGRRPPAVRAWRRASPARPGPASWQYERGPRPRPALPAAANSSAAAAAAQWTGGTRVAVAVPADACRTPERARVQHMYIYTQPRARRSSYSDYIRVAPGSFLLCFLISLPHAHILRRFHWFSSAVNPPHQPQGVFFRSALKNRQRGVKTHSLCIYSRGIYIAGGVYSRGYIYIAGGRNRAYRLVAS